MSRLKNKKLLFAITFVIVFVCFFYIQFPNERLKRRIVFEIEKNSQYSAEIQSVKIIPLLKIEIKGLTLTKNNQQVSVSKAVLKPAVLSLLTNDIKVDYDANVFAGRAFGSLSVSKQNSQLKSLLLNVDKINIDQFGQLYSASVQENVKLSGLLNGSMNLRFDNTGDFDFYIDDLDILKIKVNNFDLPQFTDLRSNLTGQIYRDRTIVNELKFDNADITFKLRGSTPPLWRLSRGSIDLFYKVDVRSSKYALLKSFLNKDPRGNVVGKIVGSLKNPQLKKANDDRQKPKKQQGPQFRKVFSPKKQQSI